ncbi:von Willebrand factor type A domain-containing protein [Parachaetomium inaequale]|uniref:von Willebrand factor type A domain-containing protein n=1 Tax=Parachaetomium inaequale TaxID=2588326 RepID=A0AAN6PD33_9PEZI|nr:von Willebrand factor type A domain-containing protein [Parachaetomium inaequale]
MNRHSHICGFYYVVPGRLTPERKYLPQLSLSAHAQIVSSTSRTTLTQNFVNPQSEAIPELRYTFPLYDGVSVVGFVCTINGDRVIRGVVKERAQARQTYQAAVDRGETAGLLEQLPEASDVFTTTVGNVPANATLKVEITYLGELKQDAEVDGIRFTIPTRIAPRYGDYPGAVLSSSVKTEGGISIVVDVEMPDGSNVKSVQSPSHPIAVTLGNTSVGAASGADMSLQKASATLALNTTELGGDFVLQVVASNTGNPIAVLETHPTLPSHRALMATLVPKFNLPSSKPEIVFLCDRSGSMQGYKNENLKTALQLFLKSLPVGVKFNICSFGSHHEFLFKDGSRTYDESSLQMASSYVDGFAADFGGTNIYSPMEDAIKKRYADMDLEVFLLTDGEIWDQNELFGLLNREIAESKGRIRVFSLGIGRDVSHALIEGVAAAGNGFSQSVGDNENMNSKVVRMLKASLTPHIKDYTLEVKYGKDAAESESDDDFEIVEKVMEGLTIDVREPEEAPKKPISLFDESANPDVEMTDASLDTSGGGKYSHVPPVSEPKFLQAPFAIPPLYPFNRTTVYLLLSPETAQKQPKSVVLRGSSAFGPVELEIPVTVLAEKSETIHQLAARKAVKALEDGRGWIYHAKDAAGALLKDKYPGRFNDMVEREAVRLGVTYQVGGKWCSFVAVEGNKEAEKAKEAIRPPSPPEYKKHPPKAKNIQSWTAPSRQRAPGSGHRRGTWHALSGLAGRCPRCIAPPTPPRQSPTKNLPSSASTPRLPLPHLPLPRPRPAVSSLRGQRPNPQPDPATLSPTEKLNLLVSLQLFQGSWRWEGRVLAVVGLGKDVEGIVQRAAATQVQVGGGASDVLATALVLAYLEVVLGDKRDEWEMLADKAREWLAGKLTEVGEVRGVEEYCEVVKGFLKSEGGLV